MVRTVVTCPSLSDPVNGSVSCTNGNASGSKCTYSCDDGYSLVGESELTCNDDKDLDSDVGEWNAVSPVCASTYEIC